MTGEKVSKGRNLNVLSLPNDIICPILLPIWLVNTWVSIDLNLFQFWKKRMLQKLHFLSYNFWVLWNPLHCCIKTFRLLSVKTHDNLMAFHVPLYTSKLRFLITLCMYLRTRMRCCILDIRKIMFPILNGILYLHKLIIMHLFNFYSTLTFLM